MSNSKEESKVEPINPSNHLKPDTIWHTAVGPREDSANEYDERYPAKKRRVSCGIEIVKCNICGYHFDSPAQLSDHLLHHDSDYRFNPIYKCSYGQCMFRTDDRPLMKHHISRVHLKSDQALISKKYRNRKFLRPTILCNTCPMVFATEAELWQHTPSCKEYRCQFCGQHFWTIEKRYSHELAYHEDEFEYDEEEEQRLEDIDETDNRGDEIDTRRDENDNRGDQEEPGKSSQQADPRSRELAESIKHEIGNEEHMESNEKAETELSIKTEREKADINSRGGDNNKIFVVGSDKSDNSSQKVLPESEDSNAVENSQMLGESNTVSETSAETESSVKMNVDSENDVEKEEKKTEPVDEEKSDKTEVIETAVVAKHIEAVLGNSEESLKTINCDSDRLKENENSENIREVKVIPEIGEGS